MKSGNGQLTRIVLCWIPLAIAKNHGDTSHSYNGKITPIKSSQNRRNSQADHNIGGLSI
jgi:hypothetical protein